MVTKKRRYTKYVTKSNNLGPIANEPPIVQGNILKGFNKDNVRLLFFNFGEDVTRVKEWLSKIAHRIPSTEDLMKASKAMKSKKEMDPFYQPQETWLHVSLSATGLRKIGLPLPPSRPTKGPSDDPFAVGMKRRNHILGDANESDPKNWIHPFNGNKIDALLIIASDQQQDADSVALQLVEEATINGVTCIGAQRGKALTNSTGHHVEHFGFRDGVSQPLIKGIDPGGNIDPKQFVLSNLKDRLSWANGGSFLVFRRLRQDVAAFWDYMNKESIKRGMPPSELAAKFFGRWKSGAPLAKYPNGSQSDLDATNENNFVYDNDPRGMRTPVFAHIRKTNPRDMGRFADRHRIMRRGIPFGVSWSEDQKAEKGLLFVCYQRDLVNQFEFIQQHWSNNANVPRQTDPKAPGPHGPDPVIGQHHGTGSVNLLYKNKFETIKLAQWVTMTGGEYFFSPSISALKNLSSQQRPSENQLDRKHPDRNW